jgi:hypothetical protein
LQPRKVMRKTRANPERVEVHLALPAFTITYGAGSQFQMNHSFLFAAVSIKLYIQDYPFG